MSGSFHTNHVQWSVGLTSSMHGHPKILPIYQQHIIFIEIFRLIIPTALCVVPIFLGHLGHLQSRCPSHTLPQYCENCQVSGVCIEVILWKTKDYLKWCFKILDGELLLSNMILTQLVLTVGLKLRKEEEEEEDDDTTKLKVKDQGFRKI